MEITFIHKSELLNESMARTAIVIVLNGPWPESRTHQKKNSSAARIYQL